VTRLTSPARNASAASIRRPVRHSSRATPAPTIYCSGVNSGGAPNLISGCPNTAPAEATRQRRRCAEVST
jgi:hypothetical protein